MREERGNKYLVHPYWWQGRNTHSYHRCAPGELLCMPNNPFKRLQIGRAVTFLQEVRKDPRKDGFKVEKDKCLMSDWIASNGMPLPRIVGPWRTEAATVAVLRKIADGKMPDKEAPLRYPVFLKACHITQGIQHGTHMVKSEVSEGVIFC